MTLVKICGLTRAEDVALAAACGAWACGFVLTDSPRQVSPAQARDLTARAGDALTVGVFGAESATAIATAALAAGVQAVQLSAGREGPTVAAVRAKLAQRAGLGSGAQPAQRAGSQCRQRSPSEPPIIAAHEIPDAMDADLVLFDARLPGRFGGTGMTLDWTAVAEQAAKLPAGLGIVLAGGLSPLNVFAAINMARPFAVDVAGGIETAPGIKDRAALTAFIAAVHQADLLDCPERNHPEDRAWLRKESED